MTLRLAVVRDFRAEGWPSMDLCADQLLVHLRAAALGLVAADLAPPLRRLAQRLPVVGRRHAAFNADRLINRHLLLPLHLRSCIRRSDLFHVADHSYAHLVHSLPAGRTGVYCHDLDAFRCLTDPAAEPRPRWFRWLAGRVLTGMQKAAVVFYSTGPVREQMLQLGLVDAAKLVHAPYGVAAEFTPDAPVPVELPVPGDAPYLLHVGGNMPRKRLDVLLDVFAAVRPRVPGLRLVQVGGPWPTPLAERLGRLGGSVLQVRGLSREQLSELYRRAAAVLVTSEAEGFGLPAIEALACGAAVVASDIPVLREVGGDAVVYCAVGDVPAWAGAVAGLLTDPELAPPRATRLAQAARYSWGEHAQVIGAAYLRLAAGLPPT